MWPLYIKLITEPVMIDLLSRTQGQACYAHSTGEDSRVTITSARLVPSKLRGANLRPYLPNDILMAVKRYGAIREIKDDAW
jgi:hypothetical protein